jgi:hypothetical protein
LQADLTLVTSLEKTYRREPMKKYKVWAKSTTYLYAYVEAEDDHQAWDKALAMDGSEFIGHTDGDWDIESTEEVTND